MRLPVTISDRAIKEIKYILASKNIPSDYGLRIGVRGGGCGATFVLGFDHKKENDLEYLVGDIPIYVQKKETLFLIGKEVDFYEGSDQRGFLFKDPAAK